MQNNAYYKSEGKTNFKKNYGRTIAVCFIIVFFTAAFTTSSRIITHFNSNATMSKNVIEVMGIQSTAYETGIFLKNIYNQSPSSPQEIKKLINLENIAELTMNPNGATFNAIKTYDYWSLNGVDIGLIFLVIGFVIKVFYNIFICGPLYVGSIRFFIENRRYSKTGINKVFSIFWLRNVVNPAWIMFLRWIYQSLWWFTIGGGIYKRYEYYMIPYLLAENPNISKLNAFEISKEMMNGHKWDTFKLDISFIGYDILNFFTLGLLNLFYVNGYKGATYTELYMDLRNSAIKNEESYSVYFIDRFLEPTSEIVNKWGNTYPYTQYMVTPKHFNAINPKRKYEITTYILFFFLFSFVGWTFEVGMHLVGDGVFVNRGTMHGPWLPIFGCGGIFVILCMRKYIDKPIFTFFTIATVCSVMEYVISVYLEFKMGVRWWDYSEYFMNFQGRICLYGALVFGFGGCSFLYFFAPIIDDFLKKMPQWSKVVISIALIVIFLADIYISVRNPNMGAGITDYDI